MPPEDRNYDGRANPRVVASDRIAVLGLGVCASECLRRARISTIGELVARGEDDLRRIRNLGEGTFREIVDALAERGLLLGAVDALRSTSNPSSVSRMHADSNDDILRSGVDILKLGVRAANCLRTIGVRTVAELVTHRPEDLLGTRNLGKTTLQHIATVLSKHSLWLGMTKHEISIRMASASDPRPVSSTGNVAEPSILSSGIHVLHLGVRATNCLHAIDVYTVEELIECSAAELARIRNLGSRTLDQIVDALSARGLSLREPPIEIFLDTLRDGLDTADAELDYIVNEVISPRKRAVVTLRLGWSGHRIPTLKELAENTELSRLGNRVTKERVRQIESNAKRAIRTRLDGICPKRVSEALRTVTEATPIAAADIPDLLRNHGLSRVGLQYSGLRSAAELTDTEWELVPLTTGKNPVLISTEERAKYDEVLRILSSERRMTYSMVSETAKLATRPSMVVECLTRLVDVHSDYRWLDRDDGVYWYVPSGRPRRGNKILYQCRKLFSLARRLHVEEIHRAVRRTRTVSELPAKHILLEMLRQTNWFLVSGNYVHVREDIRFDELSIEDRRMIRAAAGMGSTVKFFELRDNLVREGVTSVHAGRTILFSPFLSPVSRGRYRVLVNVADQSDGKMLSPEPSPQGTMGTAGRCDSGAGNIRSSVVVQVSSRALITDRIFVDSNLPLGQWDVVDADGRPVGRCRTSSGRIQELATSLRSVGAKIGDSCSLRFDVDTMRVVIQRVVG